MAFFVIRNAFELASRFGTSHGSDRKNRG